MSDLPHPTPKALPRWIVAIVSVGVVVHLFAIGIHVLAVQSGPWVVPPPVGVTMCDAPTFVKPFYAIVEPAYMTPLRFANNYHFATNRPEVVDVVFEIRIKDRTGGVTKRVFPDPEANAAVRFRQSLLAQELAQDMQVTLPRTEVIAPKGGKVPMVTFWDMPEKSGLPDKQKKPSDYEMKLAEAPQHLAPKNRDLYKPREWSVLLAQSYMRHLVNHTDGAVSAELVRYVTNTVLPENMILDVPMPGTLDRIASNFGEVKR
jgi:hypothetical protein